MQQADALTPQAGPVATASKPKRTRLLALQLAATAAAFTYLFAKTDTAALRGAFAQAPLWSVPAAVALLLSVMFAGTLRWRFLLRAYGAADIPNVMYLFRLQLIGLFYNMMPGAVGGDVLRGIVSRHAFGPNGIGAGLTVVLVERVFGLMALMLLVIGVLTVHPIRALHLSPWVLALGGFGCAAALLGIALGRRLAPHLPAPVAQRAALLPALTHPAAFGIALGFSLVNQTLVGLMGHVAVWPLCPHIGVCDSLALSPLAFAAIFFPLTVAGAGTRDTAMVALYGLLDVPQAKALSASLQILLAYVVVAALGAAVSLTTPLHGTSGSPGAVNPASR